MKKFLNKKNKDKNIEAFNESFRLLRTNLQYSFTDNNRGKCILISSAEQSDGKSTTTYNLSLKLSDLKKNILVIDTDIRNPSQHKKFNISNIYGLTDILAGECSINEGKQTINENLCIITAGKRVPTATELITSDRLKGLLNDLKKEYDYIIIDSAPINIISDAIGIIDCIDGIILVAKYRKTKKRSVQNMCKKINQLNGKVLGVVFNGMETNSNAYYYYYYRDNKYYK